MASGKKTLDYLEMRLNETNLASRNDIKKILSKINLFDNRTIDKYIGVLLNRNSLGKTDKKDEYVVRPNLILRKNKEEIEHGDK